MRITEIFRSIQGEGRLTGTESIFVRACGCNLRCRYCDTPYASWAPEGEEVAVKDILDRISQLNSSGNSKSIVKHAVLTGGEPMLSPELISLSLRLHDAGWHITIETAGTLYLPVACDLMSISPKLSNSMPSHELHPHWNLRHARNRHAPDVIRRLTNEYDYQLKFVIDDLDDCREVERYLKDFPEIERGRVMLMPQGVEASALAEKAAWLQPYCADLGFQFCPRRQVEWFGSKRGV